MHAKLGRVVLVSRVKRNPYVTLLCAGLNQLGLDAAISDVFSCKWMWRHRAQVDVLHIHWLELLFTHAALAPSLKRWASTILGLLMARLSRVRLVYTVHNIWQHEGRYPLLTWWANRVMFWLAHAVHVHDAQTAEQLARQWGRRGGVHIIPHGNYIGAYPNTCTRQEARARLQLSDDAFVYLSLGRVRPYKGLEDLLAAFGALAAPDALLLIAGEAQDPGYEQVLQRLAQGDPRIRLSLAFVPEDALQVYLAVCDVCVLPYRHVTTSGAAILSFSFGVPIIAPALGCFVALVGEDGQRGVLYNAQAPQGLAEGLARARICDLAAMRQACIEYAQQLDWSGIAAQHAAMYDLEIRTSP